MKWIGFALIVCVFPLKVLGSIPPERETRVQKILAKNSETKFTQLKKMGPDIYPTLMRLAFDEDKTLSVRWRAFMAMVRLGEREALPEVQRALESGDWFLRDAALRVLPVLDEEEAYKASVRKLNDSALVVRTTAVDSLARLKRPACVDKLWEQLYSRDNYIKKQSLWIRRHIVEALSELAPQGSEEKFIKVLADNDSTLYEPAVRGLERLTGLKLGEAGEPVVYRRHAWEKWFKGIHPGSAISPISTKTDS